MTELRTRLLCTAAIGLIAAGVVAPSRARADEQTVRLIQMLIDKGILTKGQAADLLRESSGKTSHKKAQTAASAQASEEEAPASPPGEVRVTYVPSFVRRQIADQVRADVMTQAREEGWAEPDAMPAWTRRVRLYGDLRLRYEGDLFDKSNYPDFANFTSINGGSPLDVVGVNNGTVARPATINTTEDRNRFRVRARIGAAFSIDDNITGDLRLSTGDSGPTATNATLGGTGEFSKYTISLDRASLSARVLHDLTLSAGRMNNPFFTTDMIFHNDLGFDGVAAQYTHSFGDQWQAFGTAGAFPVLNTALDFSANSETKFASNDAYLFALQAGGEWRPERPYRVKMAVGLFDFNGVQGAVSSPCAVQSGGVYYCDTDNTRAPFSQFGNTFYAIRNTIPIQTSAGTTPPNPQYFGLASRFRVLEVHPRLELLRWHPIDVVLDAEFTKNLGFNRNAILTHGPSEQGPVGPQNNTTGTISDPHFVGGDTGYQFRITVGKPVLTHRWDWNAYVAYRYLESDAVLDALNDSDFHLGGTNAKGYILGGGVGVADNTWLGLKLNSAQAVSGPQDNVDVIQLDLNTAF